MKITALGHSAFRIETGKAVILIDPFITGNPAAKPGMMEHDARLHACAAHARP